MRGIVVSVTLGLFGWPLLASGAIGPDLGTSSLAAPTMPTATLTRVGEDIIITGSVASLFTTGSFAGVNRAEKSSRARITPTAIAVASTFDDIRARLAAARAPAERKSAVAQAMPPKIPPVGAAGMRVASIMPTSLNPALGAIDEVSPVSLAPVPLRLSTELAYARENLPPTDPSKLHDKSGKIVSDKEAWCLSTAIYFEARGESYRGQVAVGQVVMNRLAHRLYPGTICGVVFQNQQMRNACQFSFACDGIPETITDKTAWAQAQEIARGVVDGSLYLPEVANATHYHASYVKPDWAPRLTKVTKIGLHIFYKFKRA